MESKPMSDMNNSNLQHADQPPSDYVLSWQPSATKGKIILRCERDKEIVFTDEVAIAKEKARQDVCSRLTLFGCDAESLSKELLSIASEYTSTKYKNDSSHSGEEIEPEAVHRPERFILPGVNGLSLPILTRGHEGVCGHWVVYGKCGENRFRCDLSNEIRISNASVYIDPVPLDAGVTDRSGWSRDSREAWIEGTVTVDPTELYVRIVRSIDHYLEFPAERRMGTAAMLAIWTMLTYHYHAWQSFPYLLVNGPASSGKSTLFRVLRELVYRPFPTDNISAAAIYRTLNSNGGTLLFDEAERLREARSPDVAEINSMLLAGYQRGRGATRLEKIGDGFKTVSYQVYGPKAIACINGVSPVLQSRCIEVQTQRAAKDSLKPKRPIESTDWQAIRDDLHIVTLEHGEDWIHAASRRDVGQQINGRDYELWQPILSIAAWLESCGVEGLLSLIESYALDSIEMSISVRTPELDEMLIRTLAEMANQKPTSRELLYRAMELNRNVFDRWTPEAVSRRLRIYGLMTTKSGGRREFRQTFGEVRSIAERYSIDI
jgi:hypothetical protein